MGKVVLKAFGHQEEFHSTGCTCAFLVLFAITATLMLGLILALIYLLVAAGMWLLAAI